MRLREIRSQLDGLLRGFDGFGMPPRRMQSQAVVQPGGGVARREFERLGVALRRFVEAPQLLERVAAVDPGVGETGLQRQRLGVAGIES